MQGGIYIFQIFDYYSCSGMVLLLFAFFECIAIAWVYGVSKWVANVEHMIQRKLSLWLKFCWFFLTPALSFVRRADIST